MLSPSIRDAIYKAFTDLFVLLDEIVDSFHYDYNKEHPNNDFLKRIL